MINLHESMGPGRDRTRYQGLPRLLYQYQKDIALISRQWIRAFLFNTHMLKEQYI